MKFDANLVVKQQNKRYYIQKGGGSPVNPVLYAGVSAQFFNIESVSSPKSGGITPINVGDPRRMGRFKAVGSESSAPDFPTATIQFMQSKGAMPRSLYDLADCRTTYYEYAGSCNDPSDFVNGWTDYVKILSNGQVTDLTGGGGSFDSDSGVMDDLSVVLESDYLVGALGFGEKAAVEIYSNVVDIVYGSKENCSECGPESNGTKAIYAVVENTTASAGEAPTIVYTVDGGSTWANLAITASASTDVPTAIEIVNNRLLVLYDDGAGGGYFVSTINGITGIPGSAWTKVTTGFVTGSEPQDIYVDSPASIFFVGKSGYVYESSSILAGVTVIDAGDATTQDLGRIDGFGETLVAVGAGASVIVSSNKGRTFTVTDNLPGAAVNTAVSVVGNFEWWVGNASGEVYHTQTQGLTAWTTFTLPSASEAVSSISDILFINDEVGYIAASSATPTGYIYSTWNGGSNWAVSSDDGTPRLNSFPTLDVPNRLAAPQVENQSISANNLAIAGLAGNGVDGIIVLGVGAVK